MWGRAHVHREWRNLEDYLWSIWYWWGEKKKKIHVFKVTLSWSGEALVEIFAVSFPSALSPKHNCSSNSLTRSSNLRSLPSGGCALLHSKWPQSWALSGPLEKPTQLVAPKAPEPQHLCAMSWAGETEVSWAASKPCDSQSLLEEEGPW